MGFPIGEDSCYWGCAIPSEQPRRRLNLAIYLGPPLAIFGVASYYAYFGRVYPSLRDVPWLNLPLALLGLAVSVIGVRRAFAQPDRYRGRIAGSIGLALSVLPVGFFCFYIFIFSYDLPAPTDTVHVGQEAPDFTLTDHAGKPLSLSALRGRKVILVFYRGYW